MNSLSLDEIGLRALKGIGASAEEALFLVSEDVALEDLLEWADTIREHFFGKTVEFCVITNARSGACTEDCRFCAQSAHHNTNIETYPLRSPDELLAEAKKLQWSPARSFDIVTSGCSIGEDLESLCAAVRGISRETQFSPCASLGILSVEQLSKLKEAGLSGYNHNLESSRSFFASICTTHTWEERYATIKAAQQVRLTVCSGGIFGLGESWQDRIDLAVALRELGVRNVPMNFLNPIPGTPLEHRERLAPEKALRIIALFRFLLPEATIRVCGGRLPALGDRQREIFKAGANALMTGNYLTTPGLDPEEDRHMVEELGLRLKFVPCGSL